MYRIKKTDQLTNKIEIVEIYTSKNEIANKSQANIDLVEMRDMYVAKGASPIISNDKGLSFCVSRADFHATYQVEQFDPHFDELSETFKPINFKINNN